MLRKFDEGRRDDFFTLWQQYVPASLLGLDFATQKFEFYLQVYFSIYPALPSSSVLVVTPGPGSRLSSQAASSRHELTVRMKAFKSYLEGRGANLAHTAEFLPYYALPYVPQPEHHPSFEGLFQSRWVDEQRLHLKAFLEDLASRASHVPLLYVMYAEHLQATDGVPRLSPRARALRASSRAHPYHSQSREASRGSVGHGGLGLSQNQHPYYSPLVRASGGGPGMGSHGGGILGQFDATAGGGSAAASPSRRTRAGLPPRSRPVSGVDGRQGASSPPLGAAAAAAAAAALPSRQRGSRAGSGKGGGGEGEDDEDLEGLIQDDDEEEGLAGEEDEEEQARAAEVLRRQREADEAADDEAAEAAMQEALRTPTNGDLPQGRAFPPAAPVDAGGVRASVALSLERLGLKEDGVLRESVQLLDSTLDGSGADELDAAMVGELMAAGAAAAAEAAAVRGSVAVAPLRRSSSCTGLAPLDYRKLKQDLQGPDTLLTARLLQALRWRLTRSRPGADRWGLIASWIEVDLLDCHTPVIPPISSGLEPGSPADDGPWSLLRVLAASPDPRVTEEVCRLSNAIASDRLGRNYLMLPGGGAVPALMGILHIAKMPSAQAAPGNRPGANGPKQDRFVSEGAGPVEGEHGAVAEEGMQDEEADGVAGARAEGAQGGEAAARAGGSGSRPGSGSGSGSGSCGSGSDGAASDAAGPPTRDGPAVQQALVALQKLSLKRAAQTQLIRMGAVAWVVDFLQDVTTVSSTAIEYGTALLMNLCLRSAGRAAAAAVAAPLLQLCETLLTCSNDQVRTYIHGTLYSVFSRAAIRDVAGTRGTAQLLEEVAQSGQAPFASQSQYILRQLYMPESDGPERDESEDEAAPDGDADMEAEEGTEDAYADVDITPETLQRVPGEPSGEELLCASGYLASTREARQHLSAVRSSVAAAAAVMAAAGRTTLRGSVLLGSLPTPPGAGGSGGGGIAEAGAAEGEVDEEEEVVEVGVAGAADAAGAAEEVDSEPDSSAPSGAGDEIGATGAEHGEPGEEDEEDGIYDDDDDEGAADDEEGVGEGEGEGDEGPGAEAAGAQGGAAGIALGRASVQGEPGPDADPYPPDPEDASECPSPSPSTGATDGPGRGGSRRASRASRGGADGAAGGGGGGGGFGSLRPSTSSSAYVALATSTASTSIMAAARALEAARMSGATLGAGGGSTIVAGGDIGAASPSSSMAASRRRSTSRPLLPPSSASHSGGATAGAPGGPAEVGEDAGGGGGLSDSAGGPLSGSFTGAPPRPPSQGLGGAPRPGSRPQSPFRAGRGSLLSSASMRRTSESGGQILATSAAAAAVAAAAAAGADGADRASQDSAARFLRRSASANGGPEGAGGGGGPFAGAFLEEGPDRPGSGAPPGGPPAELHRLDSGGPASSRSSSLGKPPLRASGAGVGGPPAPPPPLVMSSRPATGASAAGSEARRPRALSPASASSHRAAAEDAAAASPGSSLSGGSPGPALTGPAPHHISHTSHPPPHNHHSSAAPGGPGAASAAGRGRGHRPGSTQGQPFPITAAASQAFASKAVESPVPVVSLRSSQAGTSSASGTPRDVGSPSAGSGTPDGSTSARSRAIPRPPGAPPTPGSVADSGTPSGAGPRTSGPGGGPLGARVDSKRSPTPPHGRAHQRTRMGPAGANGAPVPATPPPPPSPPPPPPADEGDELPPPLPVDYTAPSGDDETIFMTRRMLPRTPPGA